MKTRFFPGSKWRSAFTRHKTTGWLIPVFCAILIALMWTVLTHQLAYERDSLIRGREAENDNLARLFEEHVRRTVAAADITLRHLETEYKRQGLRLDLAQYFRDRQVEFEPYNSISVVDGEGNLVLANVPFKKPLNFKHLENTKYHMQNATQDAFIAKPRSTAATGKPAIFITRRMNKADGSFAGNTGVGMDPRYFTSFYEQIDLGADSVVALIGRDGIIRARRANSSTDIGQDMSRNALLMMHLKQREQGHFRSTSPVDGVFRLNSYRAVKGYPMAVLVGTSETILLARFEERKRAYLWWASGISAVILLFAALVLFQISRQQHTNARLRASDSNLNEAQQIAHLGSWQLDLRTGHLHWSDEIYSIFEIDPARFAASYAAFLRAVHPDDREAVKRAYRESVTNKTPYAIVHRLLMPDGRVKFVQERGRTVYADDGTPLESLGTVQDITETRDAQFALEQLNATLELRVAERTQELKTALDTLSHAQDQLVHSEKLAALGSLVAGISHELNTPLGNALTVASTLADRNALFAAEATAGAMKRSSLDEYVRATTQGSELILRSLNQAVDLVTSFKQVAVDQASAKRREFDLKEVIEEVLSTLYHLVKGKPIAVRTELAEGLRMDGYPGPLSQVIINLFNNALDHAFSGRARGEIVIKTQRAGVDRVVIEFCDDGLGIAEDNIGKVFDPFFTTRLGQGGSGLGLNIVHNIVTGLLGGNIEVASGPQGTRFTVTLPVLAPQPVANDGVAANGRLHSPAATL